MNGRFNIAATIAALLVPMSPAASAAPETTTGNPSARCLSWPPHDEFSDERTVSSVECSKVDVVRKDATSNLDPTIDTFVLGTQAAGSSRWNYAIAMTGTSGRSSTYGVQRGPGGRAQISRMKIKVGERMFDLGANYASTSLAGCRSFGPVSTCIYTHSAGFYLPDELTTEAVRLWHSAPMTRFAFRVFMDTGEEFDGSVEQSEIVAVVEATTNAVK